MQQNSWVRRSKPKDRMSYDFLSQMQESRFYVRGYKSKDGRSYDLRSRNQVSKFQVRGGKSKDGMSYDFPSRKKIQIKPANVGCANFIWSVSPFAVKAS